jgi:hypothetical protein
MIHVPVSRPRLTHLVSGVAICMLLLTGLQTATMQTPVPGVDGTPRGDVLEATPAQMRKRLVSVTDSVTIELTDVGFDPSIVQATNGHDLEITLINTGSRQHAYQIDRLNVDVSLAPGEHKVIAVTSPPLGTFSVTSDAPGDEGFQGTLIFYI